MRYSEHLTAIDLDPAASFALKEMIYAADKRDPVDAWADAKMLFEVQEQRLVDLGLRQIFKK